jgi:endonuclease/exonuclease/phosphatase (EEP) superfamily protein YafD
MPSITVMTLNLGNGLVTPDSLETYLRTGDFDLVALVEVTPEIAAMVETELADVFPHREARGLGIPGQALLSRYPITQVEWIEVIPGRPDLLATVDLAGRSVDVMVAHPPPPELRGVLVLPREGAVEQFDRIIEIVDDTTNPILLLGDLNVTPLHSRHRELERVGMQDVFGVVGEGPGFTYPIRLPQFPEATFPPVMRIDYIWASTEWQPVSATVGDDIGSDHLPVIAEVRLGESA